MTTNLKRVLVALGASSFILFTALPLAVSAQSPWPATYQTNDTDQIAPADTGAPIQEDVSNANLNAAELGNGDVRMTAARIVNVALGFLGILCIVFLMPGIPIGIVLLCRKELDITKTSYDKRSGQGKASVIPAEIKGKWNWGAAGGAAGIYWGTWYHV